MKKLITTVGSYLPSSITRKMAYFAVRNMIKSDKDEFYQHFQVMSMEWSLGNMRRLGFDPQRIVDIGAYHGNWTRMAKTIFAEADFYMIEAQPKKEEILKKVAADINDVSYEIALLGAEEQTAVTFFELETGSGVMEEQSSVARETNIYPMKTLDNLLAVKGWNCVGLLKIDVQGYELEVLKGSSRTLENTEVVLMELSLIPINKEAPILHEAIRFMHEHGFIAYDICSLIRRPTDRALWQSDFIFVRTTSPLHRTHTTAPHL